MRWLYCILVIVSLLVSACGGTSKNASDQIAIIDWQKASSAHPRYEAMQKAKTDLEKAVKFRNEQAELGKKQIALLAQLAEVKESGKQSFLAADFTTRIAERESLEQEKMLLLQKEAQAYADGIATQERERVLAFYKLPIVNLRLRLENVKLSPEQKESSNRELEQVLAAQEHDLQAVEQLRNRMVQEKMAEKAKIVREEINAYAKSLHTSMLSEQAENASLGNEKLGQGPKELSKLIESLDKQVELKQKTYDRLREEIDADVNSALLKVLQGKKDTLVVRHVLVNIDAVDLTEKVSTELKNSIK